MKINAKYYRLFVLGFVLLMAGSALAEESPAPQPPESGTTDPIEAVRSDIAAMREEMHQVMLTLDLVVNRIMADLERENDLLRQELRRVYGKIEGDLPPDFAPPAFAIPRPGGQIIDEILNEEPLPPMPDTPPPFSYEVIKEWGRSPESAAELGGGASTLIGMVFLVPRGSAREDLEQFGRDLREQYTEYDNINIEVFDDKKAAQDSADHSVSNPAHRVLTVSKHKASGRDVILILDNGITTEIPF
jgi:hypothetical protein